MQYSKLSVQSTECSVQCQGLSSQCSVRPDGCPAEAIHPLSHTQHTTHSGLAFRKGNTWYLDIIKKDALSPSFFLLNTSLEIYIHLRANNKVIATLLGWAGQIYKQFNPPFMYCHYVSLNDIV